MIPQPQYIWCCHMYTGRSHCGTRICTCLNPSPHVMCVLLPACARHSLSNTGPRARHVHPTQRQRHRHSLDGRGQQVQTLGRFVHAVWRSGLYSRGMFVLLSCTNMFKIVLYNTMISGANLILKYECVESF